MANRVWRLPVWLWLAAIVVGSAVFRAVLGRGIVAPFIMVDEVIWAELARGIAARTASVVIQRLGSPPDPKSAAFVVRTLPLTCRRRREL